MGNFAKAADFVTNAPRTRSQYQDSWPWKVGRFPVRLETRNDGVYRRHQVSLTALGTASYNDYTFTSYAETVGMSVSYKYDDAGRTVIYSEWTISIKDRVFPADILSVDQQLVLIKVQLSNPGGICLYTSHGAGAFTIIDNDKLVDVKWGPKPLSFTTRSLGRDLAREFVWTVLICVPDSCIGPLTSGAIMAFNYSVSYNIDFLGYTTRRLNGYIQIPITRSMLNSIPDIDGYLENFLPSLPIGFRGTIRLVLKADRDSS